MQNFNTINSVNNLNKTIFSVSEINLASQKLLEGHFQNIWVQGEISNLSRPSSGHVYFSLKDTTAQIRAAFFKQYSRGLNFELRNGLLIQAKAKVSIYPERGDYQLIVEKIEIAGEGALRQAYEQLLKKLSQQGLFEPVHKKALPKFPLRLGIITSPTGAAIRDILTVLKRRFPGIQPVIFPTAVQGVNAAPEIVQALERANALSLAESLPLDVIILARGGGSLEDLWPFNEEMVARAIFESKIPVISGVGHETDFTIADFVADFRAATPSAAAECVSPDGQECLRQMIRIETRFLQTMQQRLNYCSQHLDIILKRLKHPRQIIETGLIRLNHLRSRLSLSIERTLAAKQNIVAQFMKTLTVVSPIATLNRGYAIVSSKESNNIIRSIHEVKPEENLSIKLIDGTLICTNQ